MISVPLLSGSAARVLSCPCSHDLGTHGRDYSLLALIEVTGPGVGGFRALVSQFGLLDDCLLYSKSYRLVTLEPIVIC